jgi:D-aminoacyl-tRNA deacylase
MGTLLLASMQDSASLNILQAVLGSSTWKEKESLSHGEVIRHEKLDVEALLIEELHINSDGIDVIHEKESGMSVEEVLVLSRHVSSTETPALTLHAIGVPGETPHGARGRSGGIKGTVVPPSPRFGALFREMNRIATQLLLQNEYDLTLEATHHGPVLTRPTLYLEIGSNEERWQDSRASQVWAEAIANCLALNGGQPLGSWEGEGDVMVGIGGGHYAPRHRAVISQSDVWVGHILASYALDFEEPDSGGVLPMGNWRHAIETSIRSTREAFPGGRLFVHLDRKSFKAWQRNAIQALLSELDITVLRGKQIS